MLSAGTSVTVRLVKYPRSDVRYPATVLEDDGIHIVVSAPWAGAPSRDLGFVRFEDGDLFTEHFWRDRWYSIKEVRDSHGEPKGWYCDVARPAVVTGTELVVADLELDLWVSADGSTIVRLDEDEFAASGITEREPEVGAAARAALEELELLARDGFAELLDAGRHRDRSSG